MTAAEVVRDPYTWGWVAWLAGFFLLEVPAIRDRRPGGTLSELLWEVCSIREKHAGWRWRRIGLLCLLGWLTVHLLSGGWV